jgi:hypothetical protein
MNYQRLFIIFLLIVGTFFAPLSYAADSTQTLRPPNMNAVSSLKELTKKGLGFVIASGLVNLQYYRDQLQGGANGAAVNVRLVNGDRCPAGTTAKLVTALQGFWAYGKETIAQVFTTPFYMCDSASQASLTNGEASVCNSNVYPGGGGFAVYWDPATKQYMMKFRAQLAGRDPESSSHKGHWQSIESFSWALYCVPVDNQQNETPIKWQGIPYNDDTYT